MEEFESGRSWVSNKYYASGIKCERHYRSETVHKQENANKGISNCSLLQFFFLAKARLPQSRQLDRFICLISLRLFLSPHIVTPHRTTAVVMMFALQFFNRKHTHLSPCNAIYQMKIAFPETRGVGSTRCHAKNAEGDDNRPKPTPRVAGEEKAGKVYHSNLLLSLLQAAEPDPGGEKVVPVPFPCSCVALRWRHKTVRGR